MSNLPTSLKPWKPGESGNPGGRPKGFAGIAALAREHGPRCIAVAAELLDSPDDRVRLAAAVALLDRGFGRPTQAIANEDGSSPLHLHLIAAQAVSREMIAERAAQHPPTINAEPIARGDGGPITNGTAHSLLDAPPPLE